MADLRIVLAVDSNNPDVGDLYLNAQGTAELASTLSQQVAQELWIRLHFFKGEWFLDPAQGVPYFQSILGHKGSLNIVGQIFRTVILSVPGIKSLDTFDLTREPSRGVGLTFSVTLTDGAVLRSSDFAAF